MNTFQFRKANHEDPPVIQAIVLGKCHSNKTTICQYPAEGNHFINIKWLESLPVEMETDYL